jgi:5-methylcytosine-specific restriction endonuclease McrA
MPVNNKVNIERFTDPVKYSLYEIFVIHGPDCHICSLPIDFSAPRRSFAPGWEKGLQLDHVIPLAKGGSDQIENVKPSHGLCNLSKGNKVASAKKHPRYEPVRSVPRKKYY